MDEMLAQIIDDDTPYDIHPPEPAETDDFLEGADLDTVELVDNQEL